ncbi:DUF411 domain-containing protein [Caldimonas brevitalea]|uniref:Metal-binding protein n=1 Tax=Caldimonas brevitalea TaxID=413882 RepID=A0A0G3BTJ4_9BURK|nr:DUF411 domain-containing protein [Caldimonas brevitalea]AKJ31313.1 metal-binding protein [Caldimonas brevitalea]
MSTRRHVLGTLAAAAATAFVWPAQAAKTPQQRIEVWKSPTCGCCTAWVEHLQQNGFEVTVHEVEAPGEYRARFGLPDTYGSCHTGRVGGYVLEGHVPAREIVRLLKEKPAAVGLAVPGMPVGSPGMEVGARKDPYDVLLVTRDGKARVYQKYP